MNRFFIGIGLLFLLLGLAWPWISQLPLGRLPGDIHIKRDGVDFYFPLVTSLVISILLSLLLWLWRR
ncbi:MAG TPA: DUF2905 domain-containing protein [Burkholderiaceae bacterium]|nr:DUF2905 domain-containing protein [Burkholderiaceae bacterium]